MANELLKRFVDPRTVRVTPAAKSVGEQILKNSDLIAEHHRQTDKTRMDADEDYFSSQRRHLLEFFRLQKEQKKLMRQFDSLEGRALLVQLGRNILGFKRKTDSIVN